MPNEQEGMERALAAALEALQKDCLAAGFSKDKIAEATGLATALTEEGQKVHGTDDQGKPYRIERTGSGYEFETDADVS